MLKRVRPIERVALRLVTRPGMRFLQVAWIIAALFPVWTDALPLPFQLLPAFLAAAAWLMAGVAIPSWKWLIGGPVIVSYAVAMALLSDQGTYATGVPLIAGLVLLVGTTAIPFLVMSRRRGADPATAAAGSV